MELNGIQPREIPLQSTRDVAQKAAGDQQVDAAAARTERPTTEPDYEGVRASFAAARSDEDRERERGLSGRDRLPDAIEKGAVRDAVANLLTSRLPTNAELEIDVDPETDETRIQVRNRETGDLVREIPERELTEVLRDGPSGQLVDRTM